LGQQTERSVFTGFNHQQIHLFFGIAQIDARRIADSRGPAHAMREEMPAFRHLWFQETDRHQRI